MYKVNNQGQFESPSIDPSESQDNMSTCSDLSAGLDNESKSCKQVTKYENYSAAKPVTLTPIKSQIIIMSSQEMAPSSDESETIDVGTEEIPNNPFSNLNVDDIPIEIVDDLNDLSDDDVTVTATEAPP